MTNQLAQFISFGAILGWHEDCEGASNENSTPLLRRDYVGRAPKMAKDFRHPDPEQRDFVILTQSNAIFVILTQSNAIFVILTQSNAIFVILTQSNAMGKDPSASRQDDRALWDRCIDIRTLQRGLGRR